MGSGAPDGDAERSTRPPGWTSNEEKEETVAPLLSPYRKAFVQGALFAGAPASWVLLDLATVHPSPIGWPPPVTLALQCCAAIALGVGGLLLQKSPRWGRPLATLGLLAGVVAAGPMLLTRPGAALTVGTALVLLSTWLWSRVQDGASDEHALIVDGPSTIEEHRDAIMGTLVIAGLLLLVLMMTGTPHSRDGQIFALVTAAVSLAAAMRSMRPNGPRWSWWVIGPGVVIVAAAGIGPYAPRAAMVLLLVWPVARLLHLRWAARSAGMERSPVWDLLTTHPARLMVVSFLAVALAGATALSLPISQAQQGGVSFADASFTSFSAVCVTGLVVVDTPTAYSGFGQLVILVLIQLGGLGIMTFATIALHLAGRRVGLAQEGAMASLLGEDSRAAVYDSARTILRITVAVELTGAALLTIGFLGTGDSFGTATWRGVFTAVSAYCNAGFALQTDSLVPYQHETFILVTTSLLIITGGLGPLLVVAIPGWVRRRPTPLVVKLGLVTTAILLAGSFVLIASVEWTGSLSTLSTGEHLVNAWFQAATLRTAGFNSIDISAMHPPTLSLMLAMMFIGGCPGSTAGGIKTTTAALLLLTVTASLRGHSTAKVFGRRIEHTSLVRATAIATLAVLLVAGGVILLGLTQSMAWRTAVFEVVSATGTVGLSIGGTGALDGVGKVVIIACMFAGRVGPLTLFMLVGGSPAQRWTSPAEEVAVG